MSYVRDLPAHIVKFIESGVVAEFATVTAAGAPADTPTYYFPADDLSTLDVATALPNPAKAERARRNPKVGLQIEGRPDEPVVVIAAHAAVRDADISANAARYLAETGFEAISHGLPWSAAREALTYWARVLIENTPARIYWWDDQSQMQSPPNVWTAPGDTLYPASDPKPTGQMIRSDWPVRLWQEVAKDAVDVGFTAHLTVLDEAGYPMPMFAHAFELAPEGFRLTMPAGLPWKLVGPGSLTFAGFQTFVGAAEPQGDKVLFRVERALPQHPAALDTREVLQPSEETRRKGREQLEHEMGRRGQPLPSVPVELPAPTRLAQVRRARMASDAPITGITAEYGNRGH